MIRRLPLRYLSALMVLLASVITLSAVAEVNIIRLLSIAWNPSGTMLAVGGISENNSAVMIYDVDGQLLKTLPVPSNVLSISWSPDGSKLASFIAGNGYYVWDVDTESVVFTLEEPIGTDDFFVHWSPDGTKLASSDRKVVSIWDAINGERVAKLNFPRSTIHTILKTSWSSDGQQLYTLNTDNFLDIWDVNTATLVDSLPLSEDVTTMALSPDGTQLAVGYGEHAVKIVDVNTGDILKSLDVPIEPDLNPAIVQIRWHPAGQLIAIATYDMTFMWDLMTEQEIARLPFVNVGIGSYPAIDFNPNGNWFVYLSNNQHFQIIPVPTIDTASLTPVP